MLDPSEPGEVLLPSEMAQPTPGVQAAWLPALSGERGLDLNCSLMECFVVREVVHATQVAREFDNEAVPVGCLGRANCESRRGAETRIEKLHHVLKVYRTNGG